METLNSCVILLRVSKISVTLNNMFIYKGIFFKIQGWFLKGI
jgi:hypothetical protein